MKNFYKFILGWLLHLANRDIPCLAKQEFYKIKNTLLLKYGTKVGQDIQHIRKECYSCESTGVFKCSWKPAEKCWSCSGTGLFEEFWTRLDKYRLGKFYFHLPIKREYSYNPIFEGSALPLIEGYIYHKSPKYRLGTEAALWLFLFFDWNTFKRNIGHYGYPVNKKTPLVIIGNIIFIVRHFSVKNYLPKKKQEYSYYFDDLPF